MLITVFNCKLRQHALYYIRIIDETVDKQHMMSILK